MKTTQFMAGLLLVAALLTTTGSSLAQEAEVADSSGIALLVDSYIDERFEGTKEETLELLARLNEAGVSSLDDLENVLRSNRDSYPDTSAWVGNVTKHEVECLHVDYATTYFLFVPPELDTEQSVSLVIVGHGGNSSMSQQRAEGTARMYLQAYSSMGAAMNAVLVAPASTRGWGQIGNSLILSCVSQIQRALPVDPDRIYITGQSMGGTSCS
ncbi:MAG: hypothetical protein AAF456_06930 [Planctomycetota bacterium]